MNSVTAYLKKAKEDRRRAETEIYCSQNLLAKSILKAEISSQRSSSIPQFSGKRPSSRISNSHGNEKARYK